MRKYMTGIQLGVEALANVAGGTEYPEAKESDLSIYSHRLPSQSISWEEFASLLYNLIGS